MYDQKLEPAMLTFHVAGNILLWTQAAAVKGVLCSCEPYLGVVRRVVHEELGARGVVRCGGLQRSRVQEH